MPAVRIGWQGVRHDARRQRFRHGGATRDKELEVDDLNQIAELGPVDWIVVEFPGSRFNGQIAPALRDLVQRDLIRVLDLLVLKKDADGSVEACELADLDPSEIGELRGYEAELAMLLSEDDVVAVASAIDPGSSAAVLDWENSWAAPFASAVRESGGQLVASGRIPIQSLLAAVEADEENFADDPLTDAALNGA
jgi:hypothetical protein